MLSSTDRDKAIDLLFGTDGAHFTMGRIPIGASDYALDAVHRRRDGRRHQPWRTSRISRDMMYLIPYVKAALAVNSEHPVLGQPVDAAHLDEDHQRHVNGNSCALRRQDACSTAVA